MFGMEYNGQIIGIIMKVKNVKVWLSMSFLEILAEAAGCFVAIIIDVTCQYRESREP